MRFAILLNGRVTSIQEADEPVCGDSMMPVQHDTAQVGWLLSGNKLIPAPAPTPEYITKTILEPVDVFFNELKNTFTAENILMGITQLGKTKLIADALKDIDYYGKGRSLYEVLNAINAVVITPEMAPFITTDRMRLLANKVRKYLGIPEA